MSQHGDASFLEHAWGWLSADEHLWVVRLLATGLTFLAVVILGRIAKHALDRSAQRTARRHDLDPWKTRALISRTRPLSIVIHIGLFIAAFITVLYLWGLRGAFLSVLTAAGFAGIIIGMAAANTLSNLIAGFIIFYNHPFDIGDWVDIEGHQGLVLDVKAGATILETWDGEKVTFPNRIVEGAMVKNFSHQRRLRRRFRVGIDYATDIEKARELILKILRSHPEILEDPEPMVVGVGFGESSIDLEIRFWIAPLRAAVPLIETWLMQEIQRGFAKEGIVIPFPQRTMVWRYEQGDPPAGDTVSRLAYDPQADARPFPGPPLARPFDTSSPHNHQTRSPLWWFQKAFERQGGDAKTAASRTEADADPDAGTGEKR